MDENQVKGTIKDIAGKVQDAAGALTGDADTQLRGKLKQAAGQAQTTYGETVDTVRELTTEQPLTALLAAGTVGLLLGLLLGRR